MKTFNVFAFCSVRNTARFWVCFVLCARDNINNKKNCWLFRNAEFRRRGAIKITVKVKHMEELFIILAFYRLRAILF